MSGDIFEALDSIVGVRRTAELDRIAKLPRRRLDLSRVVDRTPDFLLAARCDDPGCDFCDGGRRDARLTALQSAALTDAAACRGLFAELPVGSGKTLLGFLLVSALRARRAVFFMPPRTYRQVVDVQIPRMARHFRLELDKTWVLPYSRLEAENGADVLPGITPDVLIFDEGHSIRHRTAKRTKCVLWYLRSNPSALVAVMTGTPGPSLKHWYHLTDMTLRAGSPVPRRWTEIGEWADATDEEVEDRLHPGALLDALPELCSNDECAEPATHVPPDDEAHAGAKAYCQTHAPFGAQSLALEERARRGVREWYRATPGVVWGESADCPASLYLKRTSRPAPPADVVAVMKELKRTWILDDDEIADGSQMARLLRQLSLGFYYRWVWPSGKDHVWLQARRDWNRAVREYLTHAARPGFDSEGNVQNATRAGRVPVLEGVWRAWAAVKDRYPGDGPPREAVWLSPFALDFVCDWLATDDGEGDRVAWYEPIAFGDALRARRLFPVHGAGEGVDVLALARRPRTDRVPAALSMAHAQGMNLQRWSRALVTWFPSGATMAEQILGRHHRQGQQAEDVRFVIVCNTYAQRAAVDGAISEARTVQQRQGSRQKILTATWEEED